MFKKSVSRFVTKPLDAFLHTESASGILLGMCAVVAMIIANTPASAGYFATLQYSVLGLSIQHWINDGLMTIFFFVIGMEIKKELLVGELSGLRKAALPIMAAIGGMVVPAAIYLYFNPQSPDSTGWGIPMATDIAFALGVLTLFGSRVPVSLKIFLLALAIVDDLGAVLAIAFFYTQKIHLLGLGLAALAFVLMSAGKRWGVTALLYYLTLGVVAWFGFLYSGVHATIAGVITGLMTPLTFEYGKKLIHSYSPLEELIHRLHPWVSYGIMPIFALANAGINLRGIEFTQVISHPIHQGVVVGLLAGKPVGIFIFSWIAVRIGLASLPSGLRWVHVLGAAFLGGIGFTMAIFISSLALSADQELYSKTGIIAGSLAAAVFGSLVLGFGLRKE